MKKVFLYIFILFLATLSAQSTYQHPHPAEVLGNVMRLPVKVGVTRKYFKADFDSPLWEKIPSYNFLRNVIEPRHINLIPAEKSCVRYLCDPENLFVRIDAQDQDVTSCANANNQFHYKMGDVVEVFIKPNDHNYYWEVYGTPNDFFSCFYYKSRGMIPLPSSFAPGKVKIGLINKINGTLNEHDDRDKGWQVIIVIPRSELEKNGCSFSAPRRWSLLSARYNYSRYLDYHEKSAYPQVAGGYHSTQHFADVEFFAID